MEDIVKEKQIEKMAQLIADNCTIHKVYVNKHYPDRQKDMYYSLAEELLKHYQPKTPEDGVVITREELHERDESVYQVGVTMGKKIGGKEMASTIFDRIDENTCCFTIESTNEDYREGYAQAVRDFVGRILEIRLELSNNESNVEKDI